MKTKYFFVIYLNNDTIKKILDSMKLIADPLQRNFSHITVKGPYRNHQRKRLVEDNKLIQGKEINVLGVGNFFIGKQNTVFLKCEEKKELYDIWKTKEEKTYNEFHPHITIYDGNDRNFASNLFEIINSHKVNFSFVVDKLDLYSSKDKTGLSNLETNVDYNALTKIVGFEISINNINKLSNMQRISAIDKLCTELESKN